MPETAQALAGEMLRDFERDVQMLTGKYLGKGGRVESILRAMGPMSPEARREVGETLNRFKAHIEGMPWT